MISTRPILGMTYVPENGAPPRNVSDIVHQADGSCTIFFDTYEGEQKQDSHGWSLWLAETNAKPLNSHILAAKRGFHDYQRGLSFAKCPYRKGNPMRVIWQDAWTTAAEKVAEKAA